PDDAKTTFGYFPRLPPSTRLQHGGGDKNQSSSALAGKRPLDAQLLNRRIEAADGGVEGRRRGALAGAWVAFLLLILGFLVVYPVLTLLLGALTDVNPVVDGLSLRHVSIGNFLAVLANP